VEKMGLQSGCWLNERVIGRSPKKFQVRVKGKFIPGETI